MLSIIFNNAHVFLYFFLVQYPAALHIIHDPPSQEFIVFPERNVCRVNIMCPVEQLILSDISDYRQIFPRKHDLLSLSGIVIRKHTRIEGKILHLCRFIYEYIPVTLVCIYHLTHLHYSAFITTMQKQALVIISDAFYLLQHHRSFPCSRRSI